LKTGKRNLPAFVQSWFDKSTLSTSGRDLPELEQAAALRRKGSRTSVTAEVRPAGAPLTVKIWVYPKQLDELRVIL